MSKFYTVTFAWVDGIYCTNLVKADNPDAVEIYYERKYDAVLGVRECSPVEAESYKKRGMPFTDLTA